MPKYVPLYDGALKGQKVGSFIKGGRQFEIVRPGYDVQGKRRKDWTQAVYEGVPVYTEKLVCPVSDFIKRFEALWASRIGDDDELLDRVLKTNRSTHMDRFRNGITGETVAPTHTRDGKMQPKVERPS